MSHTCHATKCRREVPPKMFMCPRHWYMLPKWMRDQIWALYVSGQENTKTPSTEYIEHARFCIAYIEAKESEAL